MRRAPALAAALAAFTPTLAQAAGFYVGDTGARGMARAGAFVAAPDSLLAMHYNPGALTLLGPGLHLQIDVVTVSLAYDYLRSCPCVDPTLADAAAQDAALSRRFEPTSNSGAPQPVPALNVAYQFPWHKLTVGIGLWAGLSPGRAQFGDFEIDDEAEFPFGNPNDPSTLAQGDALQRVIAAQSHRYNLLELHLFEAYYAGTLAIEPIEGLRIGVQLGAYQFYAKETVSLSAATPSLTSTPENTELDVPVLLDFEAPLRPMFAAGISYTPSFLPQLSIGGSLLGHRAARAEGTLKLGVPSLVRQVGSITGDEVEVELSLPPIFRMGVQWKQPQLFTVETAVVIEGWQVYDEVVIRPKNVVVTLNGVAQELETIHLETRLETTASIRVGGELDLWEPYLGLRAGYFFEPSAVPAAYQDISTPDLDKHGFSFGASTEWSGITFEAVAAFVLMPEITITDTQRKLVNPLPSGTDQSLVTSTANGTYSGSYFIVGGSIGVSFDALAASFGGGDEPASAPGADATVAPVPEKGLASPGGEG